MAENPIQGFQTNTGVEKYDYNALANKPVLITQTEVNAAVTAANKYTDEQIAKINTNPTVQIELDVTLSKEGKAADAKAVGDALEEKLGKDEYLTENDKENLTNEIMDKINKAIRVSIIGFPSNKLP